MSAHCAAEMIDLLKYSNPSAGFSIFSYVIKCLHKNEKLLLMLLSYWAQKSWYVLLGWIIIDASLKAFLPFHCLFWNIRRSFRAVVKQLYLKVLPQNSMFFKQISNEQLTNVDWNMFFTNLALEYTYLNQPIDIS